jgi:hypothetical protein
MKRFVSKKYLNLKRGKPVRVVLRYLPHQDVGVGEINNSAKFL